MDAFTITIQATITVRPLNASAVPNLTGAEKNPHP
jgi:hypothetical protein